MMLLLKVVKIYIAANARMNVNITITAQVVPFVCAKGFSSRKCVPEFFFPPDALLPDPVPVDPAVVVEVVDVKVGFTKAVAALSQLKHAVSSAKLVPVNAKDDPRLTAGTSVSNAAGTANVAFAYKPISRPTDGTMFVSLVNRWSRSPVTELDEFRDSQSALTLVTDAIDTERAGRSRNTPASILPAWVRISMPRRTSARRLRERVTSTLSAAAAKGIAVTFERELCQW
jgi:hypothetical protein